MSKLSFNCYLIGAGIACATLLGVSAANAAEQIGVSAAVRGDVKLIPPGEAGRQATSGGPVNFMETVLSGKNSGLQVLLLDETTFTLGPDSEITIDEMVFDPTGDDSKLVVTVAQGAFRYLSGDIAKKHPESVSINTPMGNIGIRGTNLFAVETGGQWFFGLLGPGPNNNTGDKPGGFVFQNEQGSADVRRAGFGFSVIPGQAPGAVGAIPPEVFVQFAAAMAEQGGPDNGEGDNGDNGDTGGDANGDTGGDANGDTGDANGDTGGDGDGEGGFAAAADESGQTGAGTLVSVAVQQTVAMVQQATGTVATGSGQTVGAVTASLPNTYQLSPVQYADVYSYSGTATYNDVGVKMFVGAFPCPSSCNADITAAELQSGFDMLTLANAHATSVGSYDFTMTADFSKRTLSGAYKNIAIDADPAWGNTAINVANLPIDIHYNNKTGVFDEFAYQAGLGAGGAYNLDAAMTFLTSTGTKPFLAQALMVTDSGWVDLGVGGSILAPQ